MLQLIDLPVLTSITWGTFKFTGSFTFIDLVAATTNALNGALLARRPDHSRSVTIVGVLLMALLGGIGGGVTRDIMVAQVPVALTNPLYIILCLGAGFVGYHLAYAKGQLFREGSFQLLTAFALPWYAIAGAQRGIESGIPIAGSLLLAVVGPTAGRFYIDLTSGVAPKQFVRSEWFVGTAVLTGAIWILAYWAGTGTWVAAGIAFVCGYTFRTTALYRGWEEPLASEPSGIVPPKDSLLFGPKLSGRSQAELREMGLVVEPASGSSLDATEAPEAPDIS